MPPRKRSAVVNDRPKRAKRTKKTSPSEISEVTPPLPAMSSTASHSQNVKNSSLDVGALSSTISAAVSETLQAAFPGDNIAAILKNSVPDSSNPVSPSVDDEVRTITGDNSFSGIGGVPAKAGLGEPQPQQIFTSIAVGLPARVSAKLKAKIWANEYVDFGALLFSSPQNEGKYSLSMTPSAGPQRSPQFTLEPSQSNKRITLIHQWASAFNIFVSVYAERFSSETPSLMKYCEVVRDLAYKSGDWFWYDEQFRYIRQSNPALYPWDQIHWELWLRAANSFRRPQSLTNKFQTQTRQRFRPPPFPKGTCWAFQAGKHCSGCQYDHSCFKCGAKHPGSRCTIQANSPHFGGKGKGGPTQALGSTQFPGYPGKSGSS